MVKCWCTICIMILLAGCTSSTPNVQAEQPLVFEPPVSVALKLGTGYTTHPLSGQALVPIRDATGNALPTGISRPFKGDTIVPETTVEYLPLETLGRKSAHPKNEYVVKEAPRVLRLAMSATNRMPFRMPGTLQAEAASKNGNRTPKANAAITELVPCRENEPVKALPMRRKDAATYDIQYLDVEQGLGFSYIPAILKDRKGNLWLGADGLGVSRYDGISFTNYGEKEGLRCKIVMTLFEDSKGNIWIGSQNGVARFDGAQFMYFDQQEDCAKATITDIGEDKSGNIWILHNGMASVYDGQSLIRIGQQEGLPYVVSLATDSKGNLWFSTINGLVKYDGQAFTTLGPENGLPNQAIQEISSDRLGNIWLLYQYAGVAKIANDTLTDYTPLSVWAKEKFKCMQPDNQGSVWIGTVGRGLWRFTGTSLSIFEQASGLPKNKIIAITLDDVGQPWVCLDGGGISRIYASGFHYPLPEAWHNDNKVRPIVIARDGRLWMGTEDKGIGLYDQQNSRFTYYHQLGSYLPSGQRALLIDKSGQLWIATNHQGVYQLSGNKLTHFPLPIDQEENAVFDLLQDRNGHFWFCTFSGMVIQYTGEHYIIFNQHQQYWRGRVYSMLQDAQGSLWFGTSGGLAKLDSSGLLLYTEREGLVKPDVTSMVQDKAGNLWLGTLGSGLCRFDGQNFTYYQEAQGLSNNNVWSVFADKANHIWAGTDKGLNQIVSTGNQQSAYSIYAYAIQAGLRALDFNLHSVAQDEHNRLWWGTGKGVTTLQIPDTGPLTKPQNLQIQYPEINGQFFDFRNLADSSKKDMCYTSVQSFSNRPQELSLSHLHNHLTFHFSAIDWSAPDKIKYSYRLLGAESRWSQPSSNPFADYRSLQHGEYTFQVMAIGQSQVWTNPVTYTFSIRPAWWQTWWFTTLAWLVGMALVFVAVRFAYTYRLRHQRMQYEKELAVQYERQRIAAEMHDDIGAGLSGVRLLAEIAQDKVQDAKSRQELKAIHDSVGEISGKMREVIWSLSSENDTLLNLITYVQKQVRAMLEHYPAIVHFTISEPIPDVIISGDDRRGIYLCVKEAINNIIKHAQATEVLVSITMENGLRIMVADNGTGLPDNLAEKAGYGLRNMRNRIEQLQGQISFTNKNGLTIIFHIPIQQV